MTCSSRTGSNAPSASEGNELRTTSALAATAAGLFVGGAVLARVHSAALSFEVRLDDNLNGVVVEHHWLVTSSQWISTVLSPTVLRLVALPAAIALWRRRRRTAALFVAVAVEATWPLSTVTKLIVDRPRPTVPHPVAHATGASYPSGHALTSFVAVAVLLMLVLPILTTWGRTTVLLAGAIGTVVVGASRMLLGVHYLSDVLGGWLLGCAWVFALSAVTASRRRGRSDPIGWRGSREWRSRGPARSRR